MTNDLPQNGSKQILKIVFSLVLGLLFTISSLAFVYEIKTPLEAKAIGFGRPLKFITQDQSSYPRPSRWTMMPPYGPSSFLSPIEYPIKIHFLPLLVDIFFFFTIGYFIITFLNAVGVGLRAIILTTLVFVLCIATVILLPKSNSVPIPAQSTSFLSGLQNTPPYPLPVPATAAALNPYPGFEGTQLPGENVAQPYPIPTYPKLPSPKLLPSFAEVTLVNEDIPYSSDPLFTFYIPREAEYQDRPEELLGLCLIDCIKRIWNFAEKHRSFVIVMHQEIDPEIASQKVYDSLDHVKNNFNTKQVSLTIAGLPEHSWIAAINEIKGTIGDQITLRTSFGSTVIILSEQGDLELDELDLDEYFLTLQKLALKQLNKLIAAGYTKNH